MSLQFDSAYYLAENPDVAEAINEGQVQSAQWHFDNYGAAEGRDPNATFDVSYYLEQNTDVAEAFEAGTISNPFDHFLEYGAGEGRAPSANLEAVAAGFDEEAYLSANTDVATAVENGVFGSGYEHWVVYGRDEEDRPEATYNGGTPVSDAQASGLTEALTSLATAEAGVTAALASAAETVNAAQETPREDDELKDFVEQFDEDQLEAAITDAEGDIAAAEAKVNTESAELSTARAEQFVATEGSLLDAVSDANGAGLKVDLGLDTDSYKTDANIAKAVSEAQKVVNADKTDYIVVDSDADASSTADIGNATEAVGVYADSDGKVQLSDDDNAATAYVIADGADAYVDSQGGAVTLNDGTEGKTYSDVSGDLFTDSDLTTAKALQIKANNAESALNADVSANGSSQELLESLRGALGDLVKEGVTLSAAEAAGLDGTGVDGDGLDGLLTKANTLLTKIEDASDASALDTAEQAADTFLASFSTDGDAVVTEDVDTGNAAADKAVNDILDSFAERGELLDNVAATDKAFDSTLSGTILEAAEALQVARDGQKDAVTQAEDALTDAQDDLSDLNGAQDDFNAATADLEEAQQYFEDNGLELPVSLDGGVTATAENDLFLFNGEASTLAGFGLEGDDQLFIGTDFTLSAVEASIDVAGERNGDAGALEVFAQQNGNNVELFFENETFAGNAQNGDDLTQVTLTGVSTDDLSLNADGFITIA